jgi:hypothetical protein
MKDIDRWVNLEGEAPAWLQAELDAAREAAPWTKELDERLTRSFHEALAAQQRAARRKRRLRLGAAGALAAASLAGVTLAVRAVTPAGVKVEQALEASAAHQGAWGRAGPSASASAPVAPEVAEVGAKR